MTFVRVPLLKIAMPKPPFGPYVDAVQKRERILALSRRIVELAERMDESYECDPQTLAIIAQMERIMAAIKIQVFSDKGPWHGLPKMTTMVW